MGKTIKTHMQGSKKQAKPEGGGRAQLWNRSPSDEEALSHALAQLRLARTHGTHERIEIEIEIDFPVCGGRTSRTNSP